MHPKTSPATAQEGGNIDTTIGWVPPDIAGVFKTATNFFDLAAAEAKKNGFNVKVLTKPPIRPTTFGETKRPKEWEAYEHGKSADLPAGIDLSVGAVVALATSITAVLLTQPLVLFSIDFGFVPAPVAILIWVASVSSPQR